MSDMIEKCLGNLGDLTQKKTDTLDLILTAREALMVDEEKMIDLEDSILSPHLIDGQLPGKNQEIRDREKKRILSESEEWTFLRQAISQLKSEIMKYEVTLKKCDDWLKFYYSMIQVMPK